MFIVFLSWCNIFLLIWSYKGIFEKLKYKSGVIFSLRILLLQNYNELTLQYQHLIRNEMKTFSEKNSSVSNSIIYQVRYYISYNVIYIETPRHPIRNAITPRNYILFIPEQTHTFLHYRHGSCSSNMDSAAILMLIVIYFFLLSENSKIYTPFYCRRCSCGGALAC